MRIIRAVDQAFVPASHEDPRNPGVLKRVLARKDDLIDGRVQMINSARIPTHSSFRAHHHEDMEEVFIILNGHVEIRVDQSRHALAPGDAIFIAPGEVHEMINLGDHDVNYIVVGIASGQHGRTVLH